MPRFEYSRRASLDEMAREIDRRGAVIEQLEAEIERLREAAKRAPANASTAFDFAAHLQRQRTFSERTWGPGARTKGVCDHIRRELAEIEAAPADIVEWIDVVILALDGAWRSGASPAAIIAAMVAKQEKNERCRWPDWRTQPADQAIEHVRGSHD